MQECQSNLSRTFFNKNETKNFWNVSEQLIKLVKNNNKKDIFEIKNELEKIIINKSEHLNDITLLYMIALIKEGLNDN